MTSKSTLNYSSSFPNYIALILIACATAFVIFARDETNQLKMSFTVSSPQPMAREIIREPRIFQKWWFAKDSVKFEDAIKSDTGLLVNLNFMGRSLAFETSVHHRDVYYRDRVEFNLINEALSIGMTIELFQTGDDLCQVNAYARYRFSNPTVNYLMYFQKKKAAELFDQMLNNLKKEIEDQNDKRLAWEVASKA